MRAVVTMIGTGKKRTGNYLQQTPDINARMLTLYEYIELANKLIGKSPLRNTIIYDDEAISFVVENMMMGVCRFNPNGSMKLFPYICQCAKWAICKWMVLRHQEKDLVDTLSLDYELQTSNRTKTENMYCTIVDYKQLEPIDELIEEENYLDPLKLIENCPLSKRQKECIILNMVDGLNQTQIAEKLSISRQAVSQYILSAIQAMKKYCAEKYPDKFKTR